MDVLTSAFVRDVAAPRAKAKTKRKQKEVPTILPEDIQELGKAIVNSYWPMVSRFGELSDVNRKHVIKVAWELKRMNITPADVTWFFNDWVIKRNWTEQCSISVIISWIHRALQQRNAQKVRAVPTEDENNFRPASLD